MTITVIPFLGIKNKKTFFELPALSTAKQLIVEIHRPRSSESAATSMW